MADRTEESDALKANLMSRSVETIVEDVTISSGIVVTVRPLIRREITDCKIGSGKDQKVNENRMISKALVFPEMTEEEVAFWLDGDLKADPPKKGAPAGDSVKIMDAVARLSGMDKDAPKSGVSRNGKRSRR